MGASFQPGPWRISEDDLGYLSIRTGERNSAPDADLVGNIYDQHDALLVAAAPELYRAGLAVEQWITELGPFADDGTSPAPVFQRLSAALAKARGEA